MTPLFSMVNILRWGDEGNDEGNSCQCFTIVLEGWNSQREGNCFHSLRHFTNYCGLVLFMFHSLLNESYHEHLRIIKVNSKVKIRINKVNSKQEKCMYYFSSWSKKVVSSQQFLVHGGNFLSWNKQVRSLCRFVIVGAWVSKQV